MVFSKHSQASALPCLRSTTLAAGAFAAPAIAHHAVADAYPSRSVRFGGDFYAVNAETGERLWPRKWAAAPHLCRRR